MARLIPETCPLSPSSSRRPVLDFAVKIMTPVFGGGIAPHTADTLTPFRVSSIRGNLRFWWRATRGAECETTKDLYLREREIWGDTDKPSMVAVRVADVQTGVAPCAVYKWNAERGRHDLIWQPPFGEKVTRRGRQESVETSLTYAAFPFKGEFKRARDRNARAEREPDTMIEHGDFRLLLECPEELELDVRCAVWAWANFGGLGARTRRGMGSIFCQDFAPGNQSVGKWLAARAAEFGVTFNNSREWPTLAKSLLAETMAKPPIDAWQSVIGLFRDFRQGEGVARDASNKPNARHPGRSRYPEPETIREVTQTDNGGTRFSDHPRDPGISNDAFPRAELGLPIVVHFKDERGSDSPPPDTRIVPLLDGEPSDRMSSPIILKPLAISATKAVGISILLNTPALEQVALVKNEGGGEYVAARGAVIHDPKLATDKTSKGGQSPLSKTTTGSALDGWQVFAKRALQEQLS